MHDRGSQPFAEERTRLKGGRERKAKKVETQFVRYFQSGKLELLRIKPSSSSSVASSPSNHPSYPREQKKKGKKKRRRSSDWDR